MRYLSACVMLVAVAACAGSVRNQEITPQREYVIFEIDNQNTHASSARVYLTSRDCNFRGSRRYVTEVSSGRQRAILVPVDAFRQNGFGVYVQLVGASGLNVVERGCAGIAQSPMVGNRVILSIPSGLERFDSINLGVYPR